jgi:hypothetical protein
MIQAIPIAIQIIDILNNPPTRLTISSANLKKR